MSKKTVRYWSKSGRRAAEELSFTSPMSPEIQEQIDRDEQALIEALRGREGGEDLIQRVKRLRSNSNTQGFFDGYGSGYNIARAQGAEKPSGDDAKIIELINEYPHAGLEEIAERIDEYNIRTTDGKARIGFPFKGLTVSNKNLIWKENIKVPKVKQRIADLKGRAWRSLYASQFDEQRFIDPTIAAERKLDDAKRESAKAAKRRVENDGRKVNKT